MSLSRSLPTALLLAALACSGAGEVEPDPTLEPHSRPGAGDFAWVDPADVRAYQASGREVVLVDTRPEGSYSEERLPGAILVPPDRLDAVDSLPRDVWLVFYCACSDDAMAMMAARRALDAGYGKATILAGGITAWKEAGYPTVSAPDG